MKAYISRKKGVFVYGNCSIALPAEVDEAKAKAEFKKGVLKLTLPEPGRGIAPEEEPGHIIWTRWTRLL